MTVDLYTDSEPPVLPQKIDDSIWKLVYELGVVMLKDDAGDLYRTTYKHRPHYKYHGKLSPHHESGFHHWQLASILILMAQFGVLANTAAEAQQLANDMESDETYLS